MARIVQDKICFSFHETAGSKRTEGFPIYAITPLGIKRIGKTRKRAFCLQLPENTICVIRYYESNKGYITLYVYYREGEHTKMVRVYETTDFQIPPVPEEVRDAIRNFIFNYLGIPEG